MEHDHYFFRPKPGAAVVGPLSKEVFESLQARGVVKDGCSTAWRECGGTGYKIIISREFSLQRFCSCAALALLWEALMLTMILGMVALLLWRVDFDKMLSNNAPSTKYAVQGLAFLSLSVLVVVRPGVAAAGWNSRNTRTPVLDVFR